MTFAKQARALGFFDQVNKNFIALYDMNTLRNIGDAADGTDGYEAAPVNYLMTKGSAQAREFIARFKASRGTNPADNTTVAYDCITVWAQAVNEAKSTDAESVLKVIEASQFPSARGAFRFGKSDHMGEVPLYFGKVVQSKEFGQAGLDITEVVPGNVSRPSDAVLAKSRQGG